MLKFRIIFQFRKKLFSKCQLKNLGILNTFVEKTVQIIYFLNVMIETKVFRPFSLIIGQAMIPLAKINTTHDGVARDCPSLPYSPTFP